MIDLLRLRTAPLLACFLLCFCASQTGAQSRYSRGVRKTRLHQSKAHILSGTQDSNYAPDFPNINVTNDPLNDQDEPAIAVDRNDMFNLLLGEVDYRTDSSLWFYASTNTGAAWTGSALPTTSLPVATDPGVAFDANGTAYYSSVFEDNALDPRNSIGCYVSTDQGHQWSAPFTFSADTTPNPLTVADRDFIAVDRDPSSPYNGRVYVAWIEIADSASRVVEAYSSDGGHTWSKKIYVSLPKKLYQGPIPACAPNGDLYITFLDRDTNSLDILVSRSTDGGDTFDSAVVVSPYRNLGPVLPNNFIGHPSIKHEVSVNSFPSIAVDHSKKNNGKIYVAWCGKANDGRDHVYLASSTNRAASWSAPVAIENDTSVVATDKFFSWVAVDDSTGDVGTIFNDSRNDPALNQLIDAYMSFSNDGGSSFHTRRISSTSFDPSISEETVVGGLKFFGDYIGIDGYNKVWHPAWTDTRSGNDQDIYIGIVRPYSPAVVDNLMATEVRPTIANISWQYTPETSFGFPLTNYHFFIRRSDGGFTRIVPSGTTNVFDSTVEPANAYNYSVQAFDSSGASSNFRQVEYFAPMRVGSENIAPILSNVGVFPNPARGVIASQSLSFTLSARALVEVSFWNALGKEISVPSINREFDPGQYHLPFELPAAGVYWAHIAVSSGGRTLNQVQKIVVLR